MMHFWPAIGLRIALLLLIVLGLGAVIWTALHIYRVMRARNLSVRVCPSPA